MSTEIGIKLTTNGGTLLSFFLLDDGVLYIDKNNHEDVAELNKENIAELRQFLNSLPI
jgi:hypothetical protein